MPSSGRWNTPSSAPAGSTTPPTTPSMPRSSSSCSRVGRSRSPRSARARSRTSVAGVPAPGAGPRGARRRRPGAVRRAVQHLGHPRLQPSGPVRRRGRPPTPSRSSSRCSGCCSPARTPTSSSRARSSTRAAAGCRPSSARSRASGPTPRAPRTQGCDRARPSRLRPGVPSRRRGRLAGGAAGDRGRGGLHRPARGRSGRRRPRSTPCSATPSAPSRRPTSVGRLSSTACAIGRLRREAEADTLAAHADAIEATSSPRRPRSSGPRCNGSTATTTSARCSTRPIGDGSSSTSRASRCARSPTGPSRTSAPATSPGCSGASTTSAARGSTSTTARPATGCATPRPPSSTGMPPPHPSTPGPPRPCSRHSSWTRRSTRSSTRPATGRRG